MYAFFNTLLGALKDFSVFLFAYLQGKESINKKILETENKQLKKENTIEEINHIKSDLDILNELRQRDSRRDPMFRK